MMLPVRDQTTVERILSKAIVELAIEMEYSEDEAEFQDLCKTIKLLKEIRDN